MLFSWLGVAHDWGYKPSELGICEPADDMLLMVSYTRTKSLMRAYENQVAEQKRERDSRQAKARKR